MSFMWAKSSSFLLCRSILSLSYSNMYTSFTKKSFLPLLIRFQRCYVEQHKRSSDWDLFFPNSVLHQCSRRQGWITYYACPWHHLFTSLACARSTCAKWNSCIGDYFILDHLLNSYLWMPTKEKFYEYARNATHGKKCYAIQGSIKMFSWPSPRRGGTRDFKWRGWSNGAKSQDPKKSLGLPAKPKKIPGPKINPPKIPCSSEPHISNPQVTSERNQKFTKAKGNSCDGKANWLNWSGWSLVHGRAPRDNADYCITCAM